MNKLKALTKLFLSYLKKDWAINDYPLRIRVQETVPEKDRYLVQVINWGSLVATGPSEKEALSELAKNFNTQVKAKGYKPRPGKKEPLEFVSTEFIDSNQELKDSFIKDILGFDDANMVFLSDGSSIFDFPIEEDLVKKIEDRYGVNVADIENGNIAQILSRIDQNRELDN